MKFELCLSKEKGMTESVAAKNDCHFDVVYRIMYLIKPNLDGFNDWAFLFIVDH